MRILGFLKPMFLLSRKACLLYKRSMIVFWRFIFTIYYIGIPEVTWGYKGLQGDTMGYRRLQGVTGGYLGLLDVTRGYRGKERTLKASFLCRTTAKTFSKPIFDKQKIWKNLNFLTKIMDYPLWKNANFAFFLNPCLYCLKTLVD